MTSAVARDRSGFRAEGLRIGGDVLHTARHIDVTNPFNGERVGSVAMASVDQVRRAMDIAQGYRSPLSRYERAAILNRAGALLRERTAEASDLITAESGLSKKDSVYEVGRVADVLNFGAIEALRDDGQVFSCDLTPHGKRRKVITLREPLLGVITAITPFNHPMNQVAHKVVPSIATNNRMVLKPSEKVPLSALYFADLLYEAGLPPEMLQVVTGDPREIADELLTHRHVELITFTGGVSIGKYIAAQCRLPAHRARAGRQRPADRDGRRRPGQGVATWRCRVRTRTPASAAPRSSACWCTRRWPSEFTERVVEKTRAWRHGDPMDAGNDMGTVIDEEAARAVRGAW